LALETIETMGRPRKPIAEILLAGNPGNKTNREIAERIEEEQAELSAAKSDELAAVDELIAQTLVACKRGQTLNGEPNPAFKNLWTLVKSRELLLKGSKRPARMSTDELLAETDRLLAARAN
jgi:hypothetical protein